ncbi:MAG: hypothetical protein V8S32_04605 [Lachnospiraceae bacterium]
MIINFGNTVVNTLSEQLLRISCDVLFVFEHTDEEIDFATPAYWDEVIQSFFTSYSMYEIYKEARWRSNCNRVTDYKQVWGLLDLAKGEFSGRVECGEKVVYLGLSKSSIQQLNTSKAGAYLLIPTEHEAEIEEIWNYFLTLCSEQKQWNILNGFCGLVKYYPYVAALFYKCAEEAVLAIVSNSTDAIKEKFEKASHSAIITPHFRQLL